MRELATVLQKVTLSFFMRKKRSLFMKDNKNKVYKSDTRNTENKIIEIYANRKADNVEEAERAKKIIKLLNFGFICISLFNKENHASIMSKLYLTKYHIFEKGVQASAEDMFLSERTLGRYRKKYCPVLEFVMRGENLF